VVKPRIEAVSSSKAGRTDLAPAELVTLVLTLFVVWHNSFCRSRAHQAALSGASSGAYFSFRAPSRNAARPMVAL
jgi:hypothetical protein